MPDPTNHGRNLLPVYFPNPMFTTTGESPSFARASGQVTRVWSRTLQPQESFSEPVPWLRHRGLTAPGPSSLAHPICVLGLVGNGLCLHDCRGAVAREGLGKGRRDATDGRERKLDDTLALSESQESKLFLTCSLGPWAPPCWTRGGAWESHVGGSRGPSRRTSGSHRVPRGTRGGRRWLICGRGRNYSVQQRFTRKNSVFLL